MAKKSAKTFQNLQRVVLPVLQWWTLKNLSSSADLFLKLMGIVALILAADFFLLKPNMVWEVRYLDKIDRSKVEEYYRKEGKEVPAALTDAINEFLYSLDFNKQTGIIDAVNFGYDEGVPEGQHVFYLIDYLENHGITNEEKWFAWAAMREATTTIGKLTISNIGAAAASKIQVIPPPPFKIVGSEIQSFDLAPNNSVLVLIDAGRKYNFSSEYRYGDNPGNIPNIVVVWDTSLGTVNKKLFLGLSTLSIVIWLTAIVREIWFSKRA